MNTRHVEPFSMLVAVSTYRVFVPLLSSFSNEDSKRSVFEVFALMGMKEVEFAVRNGPLTGELFKKSQSFEHAIVLHRNKVLSIPSRTTGYFGINGILDCADNIKLAAFTAKKSKRSQSATEVIGRLRCSKKKYRYR